MENVFLRILNMSIASSWLILAVCVVRLAFKQLPKNFRCILWGMVGIRLLCPFTLESITSLIPSAETVSPDIMYSQAPTIHSGVLYLNQAVNPVISESFAPRPGDSVNPLQIYIFAASILWLTGMAVLIAYFLISYIRLRLRLRDAVHGKENLWHSEKVTVPFVMGFFRPRIYLPYHMDEDTDCYAIAHEQAHIRRGDHLAKGIGLILVVIHWFNPFVWLAYWLFCKDIELACDENVIGAYDDDYKKGYSEALLAYGLSVKPPKAEVLFFGVQDTKQRIKNILNYKKPAAIILAAAVIICGIVALCFLTNPVSGPNIKEPVSSNGGTSGNGVLNENGEFAEGAQVYAFYSCIYMTPFSSYYPFGDTGELYYLKEDSMTIVNSESGAVKSQFEGLSWEALDETEWEELFATPLISEEFTLGGNVPAYGDYAVKEIMRLDESGFLVRGDDQLWLVHRGGEYLWNLWSVYSLIPRSENYLTLDRVLQLAQMAQNWGLSWADFRPFACKDIGSGRCIYAFPIDDNWQLEVNSGSGFVYGAALDEDTRVTLTYLPQKESMDITDATLAEFIAVRESLKGDVYAVSGMQMCKLSEITDIPFLQPFMKDEISDEILVIDPGHGEHYGVPFSIYADGREISGGNYGISDAETGESLNFFHPSGQSAQTYILQNTEPERTYRITLRNITGGSYSFQVYRMQEEVAGND